ncbi:MAG: DUF4340 domain-containing protein [Cyanobacteria bacterium P01_G01_bin.38]
MKLQRSTWVLLGVAIALGGGVLLYETQKGSETEQAQGTSLYSFEEQDVQQLKIDRADTTIAFEKTSDGSWEMSGPQQQPAEAGAIAFLLDQLTGKPTLETLTVIADDLQKFGLDEPPATVALTLAHGTTHQLQVGTPDFSGDSLYVRLVNEAEADTNDGSGEEVTVYLVSGGLRNGIERPVEEWLVADETVEGAEGDGGDGGDGEAPEPEATEPEVTEPEASEPETAEPGDAETSNDASTSEN